MSKSLYQYKFDPEKRMVLEQVLNQAITEEKYRRKKEPNIFVHGSGWFTAKCKMQYKITNGVLSICIWKVTAILVPMLEIGCCDANSVYGVALNSSMKKTVERIVCKVSGACNLLPTTICRTVDDNFLDFDSPKQVF